MANKKKSDGKVDAYFSRFVPLFLLPADTHPDLLFDAYPVRVDKDALQFATEVRERIDAMTRAFETNPAPEDAAQAEADLFVELFNG